MIKTSTRIDARSLINRALGYSAPFRFIQTKTGFWWCEIRLSPIQYTRASACCPGETQMSAAVNAVKQAERLRKAAA